MPNGHDVNWLRVCSAIDGFHARYRRWPTHIYVPAAVLSDLESLFSAQDFLTITSKITFVLADEPIVAKDHDGGRYAYTAGAPDAEPIKLCAREWFGVAPRPNHPNT